MGHDMYLVILLVTWSFLDRTLQAYAEANMIFRPADERDAE
jgi:hypothetical protein